MPLRTSLDARSLDAVTAVSISPVRLMYQWLVRSPVGPHAVAGLAAIALLDACLLPIPPELLLVPMIVNRPKSAWRLAAVASTASLVGGVIGYGLGRLCYGIIESDMVLFNGLAHWIEEFQRIFARWGTMIIIVKGLAPIPNRLVSLGAGMARYDFGKFLLACAIARIIHYSLLASILRYWYAPVALLLERHLERVALLTLLMSGAMVVWLIVL
jgi:membrane protein YqaA with SNARE-associated domain